MRMFESACYRLTRKATRMSKFLFSIQLCNFVDNYLPEILFLFPFLTISLPLTFFLYKMTNSLTNILHIVNKTTSQGIKAFQRTERITTVTLCIHVLISRRNFPKTNFNFD